MINIEILIDLDTKEPDTLEEFLLQLKERFEYSIADSRRILNIEDEINRYCKKRQIIIGKEVKTGYRTQYFGDEPIEIPYSKEITYFLTEPSGVESNFGFSYCV